MIISTNSHQNGQNMHQNENVHYGSFKDAVFQTKSGYYIIKNKVNGKVYIGISSNIKRRMYAYRYSKDKRKITRAISKYGIDNMDFQVCYIEDPDITYDILTDIEENLILLYRSTEDEFGYNLSNRGRSVLGCKLGPQSEDQKRKHSEFMKGRIASIETKLKMSNSQKGKILSQKHKDKLSKSKIGNNNPMFGKRGKDVKTSKVIHQYDKNLIFIKTWDSLSDAARFYKTRPGDITRSAKIGCCCVNYNWRYELV